MNAIYGLAFGSHCNKVGVNGFCGDMICAAATQRWERNQRSYQEPGHRQTSTSAKRLSWAHVPIFFGIAPDETRMPKRCICIRFNFVLIPKPDDILVQVAPLWAEKIGTVSWRTAPPMSCHRCFEVRYGASFFLPNGLLDQCLFSTVLNSVKQRFKKSADCEANFGTQEETFTETG